MRMVPTIDKHVNMLKKLENDHPIVSTVLQIWMWLGLSFFILY